MLQEASHQLIEIKTNLSGGLITYHWVTPAGANQPHAALTFFRIWFSIVPGSVNKYHHVLITRELDIDVEETSTRGKLGVERKY